MRLKEGTTLPVALVVEDLERSVRFYRDILGMKEIKQVFVHDDKARHGRFSERGFFFRTFTLGPLALKLITVKTAAKPKPGLVDSATGVRYLAFVVDDLDATYKELQEKGVQFLSEILPAEPEHGIGRLVFFRDPDGNLLELYGD